MQTARCRPNVSAVTLRVAARTDIGLVRPLNEDSYLVADLESRSHDPKRIRKLSPRGLMLTVCDGMGGAAAGEIASQMAVKTLARRMETSPLTKPSELAQELARAVHAAGDAIRREAINNPSRHGMGTTCTAAVVYEDKLFVGQVGDSRAYVFRNGSLTQVTKDQSLVSHLVELGQLTEAEAEHSPKSNVILQALGTSEKLSVDITSLALFRGDRLLLCSDGLSGLVEREKISAALLKHRSIDECADVLIELARKAGGRDNITVILCDVAGKGLAQPASNDVAAYRPYDLDDARLYESKSLVEDTLVILPLRRRPLWTLLSSAVVALVLMMGLYWRTTRAQQIAQAPLSSRPTRTLSAKALPPATSIASKQSPPASKQLATHTAPTPPMTPSTSVAKPDRPRKATSTRPAIIVDDTTEATAAPPAKVINSPFN